MPLVEAPVCDGICEAGPPFPPGSKLRHVHLPTWRRVEDLGDVWIVEVPDGEAPT